MLLPICTDFSGGYKTPVKWLAIKTSGISYLVTILNALLISTSFYCGSHLIFLLFAKIDVSMRFYVGTDYPN